MRAIHFLGRPGKPGAGSGNTDQPQRINDQVAKATVGKGHRESRFIERHQHAHSTHLRTVKRLLWPDIFVRLRFPTVAICLTDVLRVSVVIPVQSIHY